MRLTLPYFGFYYRWAREIFLGFFSSCNHGLCRGFRAGVVADAGAHNILAVNYPTAGTVRVADRDTIIKRNKEGIGVSVKKAYAIGHVGVTRIRMNR